jgi:hypothetical protein
MNKTLEENLKKGQPGGGRTKGSWPVKRFSCSQILLNCFLMLSTSSPIRLIYKKNELQKYAQNFSVAHCTVDNNVTSPGSLIYIFFSFLRTLSYTSIEN